MTKEELAERIQRDSLFHDINNWIDNFFQPEQNNINNRVAHVLLKHQKAYANEGIKVSRKFAYVGNTVFRNDNLTNDGELIAIIHITVTAEAFDILNQMLKKIEDERKVRQYLSILCSDHTEYSPLSDPVKSISITLRPTHSQDRTKQKTFIPTADEHKVKPVWFRAYVELDEILMFYFVRRMGVC